MRNGQFASQGKSSGQDALDDMAFFDAGEAGVEAAELVGEAFEIDAEAVEDGGL